MSKKYFNLFLFLFANIKSVRIFTSTNTNDMESSESFTNMGYIYIIYDFVNELFRVGKTKNSSLQRPKSQIAYLGVPAAILYTFKFQNYNDVETFLHRKLKKYNTSGDWYNCSYDSLSPIIEETMLIYEWIECDMISPMEFIQLKIKAYDLKDRPFKKKKAA